MGICLNWHPSWYTMVWYDMWWVIYDDLMWCVVYCMMIWCVICVGLTCYVMCDIWCVIYAVWRSNVMCYIWCVICDGLMWEIQYDLWYMMCDITWSNRTVCIICTGRYGIMLACWQGEPRERPTFSALVEILGDLLQENSLPVRKHIMTRNKLRFFSGHSIMIF